MLHIDSNRQLNPIFSIVAKLVIMVAMINFSAPSNPLKRKWT